MAQKKNLNPHDPIKSSRRSTPGSLPANNTVEAFLDSPDGAAHLLSQAKSIARLQAAFISAAPPGLAGAARVSNVRAGKVIIHAENGAVASKLRQLTTRLQRAFDQTGTDAAEIELKVRPRHQDLSDSEVALHHRASGKRPMSDRARALIANLQANLSPDSELAQALQLLSRPDNKA